jgi:hypothetical protein
MTDKMVQITVEILDIIATATNEMKQSTASESDLRLRFHDTDIVSEKFLKRAIGRTDLEDGMKKLDKLTNEEVAMASAQLLRVTHNINNNVTEVNEGVRCVDENVLVIKSEVQLVSENINAVDEMVQSIADGRQSPKQVISVISHFDHLVGMATAKDVKVVIQRAMDGIDNVKLVNDNVKAVGDMVQTIAGGGQRLSSESQRHL